MSNSPGLRKYAFNLTKLCNIVMCIIVNGLHPGVTSLIVWVRELLKATVTACRHFSKLSGNHQQTEKYLPVWSIKADWQVKLCVVLAVKQKCVNFVNSHWSVPVSFATSIVNQLSHSDSV